MSFLPFQIVGLSLLSFCVSILLFTGHWSGYSKRFVFIINAFSLFFIVFLLLANLSRFRLYTSLFIKEQLLLILTSVMEWSGLCLAFLAIGVIMGIDFHPVKLMILIVAANVVGILSAILGGLGTFDVIVLAGLMSMGYSGEMASTWLIFYRVAVFVFPFILGTGVFIRKLVFVDQNHLSRDLGTLLIRILQKANSAFIYLYGLFFIASVIDPEGIVYRVGQNLNFHFFKGSRLGVAISMAYITVFVILMVLLFKALLHFLKSKEDKLKRPFDKEEFLTFTGKYHSNLYANLYLTGDKNIFYYENEAGEKTVAFQYAIEGNKVLVVSEPIGSKPDTDLALDAFIAACDKFGYHPVFFEVGEETTLKLHEYGFHFFNPVSWLWLTALILHWKAPKSEISAMCFPVLKKTACTLRSSRHLMMKKP